MTEFAPTHEVPAGGIDAWTVPDPDASPVARLDGGLGVEVLEETTGWAHVRCSNAWEAWVAAAALVATASPTADEPADDFAPTHRVGPTPLDARDRPDQQHAVAGQLDPGLPVVEVDRWGDWVHVRCSNGWEAWVDGRMLVPYTDAVAGVAGGPTPAMSSAATAPGASGSPTPASPLDVWVPVAGAALALVGSFLPWFSAGGQSISAWDLQFVGLFTHEPSDLELDTGPVLLLLVLAALPLLTHRPLPRWSVVALGGLAALCAVLAMLLPDPKPDFGVGLFLTLIGGAVMIVSAFVRWNPPART